jgi:hypothetical protein
MKWAGIGVTGLAFALFLAAGGRTRRKASREARKAARADRKDEAGESTAPPALGKAKTSPGTQILPTERQRVPADRASAGAAAKGSRKSAPPDDDDMKDIEDILRKRGL